MQENCEQKNFFEKVYDLVCQIPEGKVASYGQIAAMLDHPRAARMVGWAMSQLPENTIVPWQRVINSRGRVSIKSSKIAAELQQSILEAEGIKFDERGYCDMGIFQWRPELEGRD